MKKKYIITVESERQSIHDGCDGCVFDSTDNCPTDCEEDTVWRITDINHIEDFLEDMKDLIDNY